MNQSTRSQILSWLQNEVPESRIRHVLRVETMAIELANYHNLDSVKAGQAGLMHDSAKFFKPEKLLAIAEHHNLDIDPISRSAPHLLHAEVGAIVARETFGVTDPQILDAIANHTLGKPAMDGLSCIIFLADSLEPGRGQSEELEHLRSLCLTNLNEAVWRSADFSLQYLLRFQKLIHPRTVMTRNWFLQEVFAST